MTERVSNSANYLLFMALHNPGMNSANKILHRVVIELGAEEFFIKLRRRANFLRKFVPVSLRHKFASVGKFVPHSSSHPKDDSYFLTRDNTAFKNQPIRLCAMAYFLWST